jgi:proline dehydrogenase
VTASATTSLHARLVDAMPGALIRLFARPYVAGEGIESGLSVARRLLRGAGIVTTLDLLAEEVRSDERARANVATYLEMVRGVAADPEFRSPRDRPTLSLKPSSFTASPLDRGGDARGSREAIEEIAAEARRLGVALTIDMEDHRWTDWTLAVAVDLFRRGFDVGTVLQTRLHRTEADLAAIPEGMRLRMVIGIYLEPADVALADKATMKERLIAQSARLLERGVYVEFASHDDAVVRRFLREVIAPRALGGERYEVQMLYGVPRAELLAAITQGSITPADRTPPAVRLYVPFATAWDQATAYCRRRLRNNPNMAGYVVLNLLHALRGRSPGIAQYEAALGRLRRRSANSLAH